MFKRFRSLTNNLSFLNNILTQYGIGALLILIALEYACFPISSEIVLPLAGALSSLWETPFILILFLSVAAGLVGTSICYCLGRYGGRRLLNWLINKFPRLQKSFDKSFDFFNRHGAAATCFSRVIPICRTYIGFVAGIMKQRFVLFILSSAVGIIFWNTLLIGLGFYLRENANLVAHFYQRYKYFLFTVIFILLLIKYLRKYYTKNSDCK